MIPTNIKEEERKLFTETLAKLVEAINPEKIICYGNRTDYHESWSSFLPIGAVRFFTYYDLVIITRENDGPNINAVMKIVDAHNQPPIHITAVVRDIARVNTAIQEREPFFVSLFHKGVIVYDGARVPLVVPPPIDEEKRASWADGEFNRKRTLAQKYHTVAGLCIAPTTDRLNDMSVFMLHQAAAYACRAIIRYYTGLRADTPELPNLLWLMRNFTLEADAIFPQSTVEEKELFDTLENAYYDVRHGHDYKIPMDRILILRPRVGRLIELVDRLHLEKKNLTETPGGIVMNHE